MFIAVREAAAVAAAMLTSHYDNLCSGRAWSCGGLASQLCPSLPLARRDRIERPALCLHSDAGTTHDLVHCPSLKRTRSDRNLHRVP